MFGNEKLAVINLYGVRERKPYFIAKRLQSIRKSTRMGKLRWWPSCMKNHYNLNDPLQYSKSIQSPGLWKVLERFENRKRFLRPGKDFEYCNYFTVRYKL